MATTYTLSFLETDPQGAPLVSATILIELTTADYTSTESVLPEIITLTTDANGAASVSLISNADGSQGTQYRIRILNTLGATVDDQLVTMPAANANFRDLIETTPPSTLTQAETTLAAVLVNLALTNADVVLTNADVVLTGLDVVLTAADVVLTAADVVLTGLDVTQTIADAVTTQADAIITQADASITAADVIITNADVVLTGIDLTATNADVVLTGVDVVATIADVVLSHADVVLTGIDVTAAASSASSSSTSATASGSSASAAASSASSASNDATNTATDAAQTALDVIATAADVVLTGIDVDATIADVVLTHADVVLTGIDLTATNADVVLTGIDLTATNADLVLTNADVVLTGIDVAAISGDRAQTAADVVSTGIDLDATNADVVITNADVVITNADVVITNADVVITNADVVTTNANVVIALEAQQFFLGSFAADPTLDNQGEALVAGAMYLNSGSGLMRTYNGSSWGSILDGGGTLIASSNEVITGNWSFTGANEMGGIMTSTNAVSIVVDNLTTGKALRILSDSANTSARSVVYFENTDVLATSAETLQVYNRSSDWALRVVGTHASSHVVLVQNTGVGSGLEVSQTGNGHAILVDTDATSAAGLRFAAPGTTTGNVIDINSANALTTGAMFRAYSNAASTGSRNLAFMHNDNTLATGATVLELRQDAIQRAMFIDQNANAIALSIDTESTEQAAIDIATPQTTIGSVINMPNADSLTSGRLLNIRSNSASTSSRSLIFIKNTNSLAVGTIPLVVEQVANKTALFIDQNANGIAIEIDTESTTANAIVVDGGQLTNGAVFRAGGVDSLVIGAFAILLSNSASGSTRILMDIANDNSLATGAKVMSLRQKAASVNLFLDSDADGISLDIDSEATTANVINITDPKTTTGLVFSIQNANVLTTGGLAYFHANGADNTARTLVEMRNDNTGASGTTVLKLVQDANQTALNIDMNANASSLAIDSIANTVNTLAIQNAQTTSANIISAYSNTLTAGRVALFTSDSTSTTGRNLVEIINNNTLATGAVCLKLQQDTNGLAALFHKTGTGGGNAFEVENDGVGSGILIDQDGNGVGLTIATAATTANVISISTPGTTTGNVINITLADTLTTGRVASFVSNSASTNTRQVAVIRNNNALAANTTVLELKQVGDERALFVDQDGNGVALEIDSEATTVAVVSVSSAKVTTANALDISATDSLTTGRIANFHSNSAATDSRTVVQITNDNTLAVGVTVLTVKQDAAQQGLFVDQNGNATALHIDTEATSNAAFDVNDPKTTTTFVIRIDDANALTNGGIADFSSDSADTDTRTLMNVHNDNTLATGTTVLTLQQDADKRALFINMDGNANSILIDSEATTSSVIDIISALTTTGAIVDISDANALTTGGILDIRSNSVSTAARQLLVLSNINALATGCIPILTDQAAPERSALFRKTNVAGGDCLVVQNDGTGAGVLIDQNGNGNSLVIDNESTTVNVLVISPQATTTGNVVDISDANALTTGGIANFVSDSVETGSRNLLHIHNNNTLATGTIVARLTQDADQFGMHMDQNGNGVALNIDTECTTVATISIDADQTTTGNVFVISANSLTTGKLENLTSNSASTETRNLISVVNDNTLAVATTCLALKQDAAKRALFIDQNANGISIEIDSETTTANVIDITSAASTTGSIIATTAVALTTGSVLNLQSNSADTGTRNLSFLLNDNALATGATVLVIQQDSTKRALFIDQNGIGIALEIDSESTTATVISIVGAVLTTATGLAITNTDALTTGVVANFHSNSADTGIRTVVKITNDNPLAVGAYVLELRQDAAESVIFIDQNDNAAAIEIDSESTTAEVISVVGAATTGGMVLAMRNTNGLTTGRIAYLHSNGADTNTRNLVEMRNDNPLATGATVLVVINDSTGDVATFTGDTGQFLVKRDGDCENTNNAYGAISDIKFKTNIVPVTPQSDIVKSIAAIAKTYELRSNPGKVLLGVIAQDMLSVAGDVVRWTPDMSPEGGYYGVNYSGIYMKTTVALGEAIERADIAEARADNLEARLARLEQLLADKG